MVIFNIAMLSACFNQPQPAALVCEDVAILDEEGKTDPCDVAACGSCLENCGVDCMILESYPPQYACEGAGTWSVYDECPDWLIPGSPYATGIENLGCGEGSRETLTASSPGAGRVEITHVDYATGCCPQDISIEAVVSGESLTIAYNLVSDLCECACELDIRYALVQVPAGTWTVIAGNNAATATVVVP